MNNRPVYTILFAKCVSCGAKTTKQYARIHAGKCKACVSPATHQPHAALPTPRA